MSRNEKQYFLNWEESANSTITEVGGKGQNLGSLHRYGFLVPAGGVITASAYLDFLQQNRLTGSIHAASSIQAEEALENEEMLGEIRRKIDEGRMPDTIRQEMAERLAGMELVPAVASGVAFSCDPLTGRRDRIAISANFGLGESVVSGAIDPDEYLLDTMAALPEIVEKKIGSKKKYTRLVQSGGTELVNTAGEENGDKRPVLSDNQIIELGSLTLRVFEALGKGVVNQDIEWAFDGKKFHVLQARPVTNLKEPTAPELAGQPVIWSNANIKDAVPMVLTALSWSLIRSTLDMMMNASLLASGYRMPEGTNWVRFYKGRGYFNLSAFQWGYYDGLGYLPAEINAGLGGHPSPR